jgi:hypothetical protein
MHFEAPLHLQRWLSRHSPARGANEPSTAPVPVTNPYSRDPRGPCRVGVLLTLTGLIASSLGAVHPRTENQF